MKGEPFCHNGGDSNEAYLKCQDNHEDLLPRGRLPILQSINDDSLLFPVMA